MSDTTATTRAEILEEEKRKIDEQIEVARANRDNYVVGGFMWELIDVEIDRLLAAKDNLHLCVPSGWIEPEWYAEVDAQMKDYADEKATEEAARY